MLLHWTLPSQFWTFFAITKTKHVFFFFTQIGLRCLSLHYIGSQWVKTVYMKQTIDTTQLKPSMLVVMNSTSNNSNVTFNHIQHEHAWTDLLSALQQDCLAALRLWMQIPVQPVSSPSIQYLHAIGFLFENEHRPVTVTLRLRDGFDAVCFNDLGDLVFNTALIVSGNVLFITTLQRRTISYLFLWVKKPLQRRFFSCQEENKLTRRWRN